MRRSRTRLHMVVPGIGLERREAVENVQPRQLVAFQICTKGSRSLRFVWLRVCTHRDTPQVQVRVDIKRLVVDHPIVLRPVIRVDGCASPSVVQRTRECDVVPPFEQPIDVFMLYKPQSSM